MIHPADESPRYMYDRALLRPVQIASASLFVIVAGIALTVIFTQCPHFSTVGSFLIHDGLLYTVSLAPLTGVSLIAFIISSVVRCRKEKEESMSREPLLTPAHEEASPAPTQAQSILLLPNGAQIEGERLASPPLQTLKPLEKIREEVAPVVFDNLYKILSALTVTYYYLDEKKKRIQGAAHPPELQRKLTELKNNFHFLKTHLSEGLKDPRFVFELILRNQPSNMRGDIFEFSEKRWPKGEPVQLRDLVSFLAEWQEALYNTYGITCFNLTATLLRELKPHVPQQDKALEEQGQKLINAYRKEKKFSGEQFHPFIISLLEKVELPKEVWDRLIEMVEREMILPIFPHPEHVSSDDLPPLEINESEELSDSEETLSSVMLPLLTALKQWEESLYQQTQLPHFQLIASFLGQALYHLPEEDKRLLKMANKLIEEIEESTSSAQDIHCFITFLIDRTTLEEEQKVGLKKQLVQDHMNEKTLVGFAYQLINPLIDLISQVDLSDEATGEMLGEMIPALKEHLSPSKRAMTDNFLIRKGINLILSSVLGNAFPDLPSLFTGDRAKQQKEIEKIQKDLIDPNFIVRGLLIPLKKEGEIVHPFRNALKQAVDSSKDNTIALLEQIQKSDSPLSLSSFLTALSNIFSTIATNLEQQIPLAS